MAELGDRPEMDFDEAAFEACSARTIPAEDYQALVGAYNSYLPPKVIYLHIYLQQKEQRKRA